MRARSWAFVGLAVAGAQAGHLLVYQVRFGGAARQIQSSGAHVYFPAFAKTALGVLGLAVIAALLVIAVARVAARGPLSRRAPGPSYVGTLAALFTLQLALFTAQEIAEALISGVSPAGADVLLLWGMAGQLPVAVAGAAVLVWLGERVEAAIANLGAIEPAGAPFVIIAPLAMQPVFSGEALATAHAARSRMVKRGPPAFSWFRPL